MSRQLAAILALAACGIGFAADPPEKLTVPPRPVEGLKLPPGAVVIVSGNPQDALGKVDAVVLSPEEYRRLLDTIEQLRKQATPDKPEVPSKCRLSARVETTGQQEIVKVHATFEFFTAAAKTTVALGCRNSGAVAAVLDDKLPALQSSDAGYSVVVESPGPHQLTLDLELPLTSRGVKGGERGFTLHLPGSPITLIDKFELPAGVTAARLGRLLPATAPAAPVLTPQAFPAKSLVSSTAGQPALALGPVDGIELFWDVPAAQKPADPLLRAAGEIGVRVEETQVMTTARLALRCLTGRATEWKIQAPVGSEVSVEAASATDWDVSQADDKSVWLVRAIGPGAEALRVEVLTRATRKGGPVPVGPYLLAGALRQEGVIRVGAPSHLRPRFSKLRADVTRGESEAEGVLAFHYGSTGAAGGQTPWLFADAEPMRGEVRTQVTHQLTLAESGWRLSTDVKATPIRIDLDHLDLDIPAAVQDLRATPPELVESVVPRRDLGPTRWQVRLAQPKKGEVHLKLEGFYPVPSGAHEASLLLPRVAQTFDRDGRVVAVVPEKLEVHGQVFEWERDRVNEWGRPLEATAGYSATAALTATRSPARVDLTWGPTRSELVVESVVDLILDETTAVARHRLTLPPSAVARQLEVRPGVGPQPGAPHLIDGARLTARESRWLLDLPPSPTKEQSVVFSYVTPLPAKESAAGRRRVDVGLYWPEGATRCETRLRLWGRSAATTYRPSLSEGPWEELPTEAVADRVSLPALVLRGSGIDLPLELALTEVAGLTPAGLVAERVLVVATAAEAGRQDYLVRFLFSRGAAGTLEFELPASPAAIGLRVRVGKKLLDQVQVLDDFGAVASVNTGRIVRVPLQGIADPVFELTLEYHLPAARHAGQAGSAWSWAFSPPRLRGPVLVRDVRWYVELPGDGVILSWDAEPALQQKWGRRRLLPALRPAWTGANLESWFHAGVRAEDTADDFLPEAMGPEGVAVARADSLVPLRLTHIPRTGWVLACSLTVLAVGIAISALRRVPLLFWLVLAVLPLALGAAAVMWPQPVALALAAAPPGLIVLGVMLLVQWLLRSRYRRRVVFMPGFTRVPDAGSARSHVGSSLRRREPSTVDAPAE